MLVWLRLIRRRDSKVGHRTAASATRRPHLAFFLLPTVICLWIALWTSLAGEIDWSFYHPYLDAKTSILHPGSFLSGTFARADEGYRRLFETNNCSTTTPAGCHGRGSSVKNDSSSAEFFQTAASSWLQGERLGNSPESDLLSHEFIDSLPFMNMASAQRLLQSSLCYSTSRFVTPIITQHLEYDEGGTVDQQGVDNNDDEDSVLRSWTAALVFLAVHVHQHSHAVPEARIRAAAASTKPTALPTAAHHHYHGIGRFDYQCPDAQFLVVRLSRNGLGANLRLGAVPALMAGVATNRVVLYVNNLSNVSDYFAVPWSLASCPRHDHQCLFLPTTPCVITKDELVQAYTLKKKEARQLFRNGTLPESHQMARVIVLQLTFRPQVTSVLLPISILGRIADVTETGGLTTLRRTGFSPFSDPSSTLPFQCSLNSVRHPTCDERCTSLPRPSRHGSSKNMPRWNGCLAERQMTSSSTKVLPDPQSRLRQRPTTQDCTTRFFKAYYCMPRVRIQKRPLSLIGRSATASETAATLWITTCWGCPSEVRNIPMYVFACQWIVSPSLQPDNTSVSPASDKCASESECFPLSKYLQAVVQLSLDGTSRLQIPKQQATVVLTTESAQVLDELRSLKNPRPGGVLVQFLLNRYDVLQGTGYLDHQDPSRNVTADESTLSALISLKLQLATHVTVGNCCSNFHLLLADLLRVGCGLQSQNTFQCLQDNPDPDLRPCCSWDRSLLCQARRNQTHTVAAVPA